MDWPSLTSSPFPSNFTRHSTELSSVRVPSNNAQWQPAGPLSCTVRECAQLNPVTTRWEAARQILHCNSLVLMCLPVFHGLGKINEKKLFCPKPNSCYFKDAKHLIWFVLAWMDFCQWNKMPPLYSFGLIGRPQAQWSSCVRMALCHPHDLWYYDLNSFYSHFLQKQLQPLPFSSPPNIPHYDPEYRESIM